MLNPRRGEEKRRNGTELIGNQKLKEKGKKKKGGEGKEKKKESNHILSNKQHQGERRGTILFP